MQTILVVDDEPDIAELLQRLLEGGLPDVRVVTAGGGEEALAVLKKQPIDLLLSDYRMPGMDGLQLLDAARKAAPGMPRILITAFPDLQLALRAINEAAVDNFLVKPFRSDEVLDHVRSALFKRRIDTIWKESLASALGTKPAKS